jgi:hypothetical protein
MKGRRTGGEGVDCHEQHAEVDETGPSICSMYCKADQTGDHLSALERDRTGGLHRAFDIALSLCEEGVEVQSHDAAYRSFAPLASFRLGPRATDVCVHPTCVSDAVRLHRLQLFEHRLATNRRREYVSSDSFPRPSAINPLGFVLSSLANPAYMSVCRKP